MFHLVLPQPGICFVHVANNDGDVLEPAIIAARIHWNWATLGREIFRQFDGLAPKPHSDHAHSQSEHAFEMLVVLTSNFGVRYFLEREHLGIEIHRSVHIGDRDSDRVYSTNQSWALLAQGVLPEELGNSQYQ